MGRNNSQKSIKNFRGLVIEKNCLIFLLNMTLSCSFCLFLCLSPIVCYGDLSDISNIWTWKCQESRRRTDKFFRLINLESVNIRKIYFSTDIGENVQKLTRVFSTQR